MTVERLAYGKAAEERAAAWYRDRRFEVVDRNWRCREGELDVVAFRPWDRLLVVCEVKARRSAMFGTAAQAVDLRKQVQVRRLAARWLTEHPVRPRRLRFDVATLDAGTFAVLEGVF